MKQAGARHEPLPSDLAVALRAARERLHLPVPVTAELVGISKSYLWALERAASCPSTVVAQDLIDVLDLPSGIASWLLAVAAPDAGRSHPNAPAADHWRAGIGREIARLLREAEAEHQPRTLRVGREIEARISRADEDRYADEARERQEAEWRRERSEIDRLIAVVEDDLAELRRRLGRLDRATYRRFDRIRRDLGQFRSMFGSADTI